MKRLHLYSIIALAFIFSVLPSVTSAFTHNFTVNSTADTADANPGDEVCADASAQCTLRAAIQEANALSGATNITLPAGIYTLSLAGGLDIIGQLNLTGASTATAIVDGGAVSRVFHILSGANVTVTDATVRNGDAQPAGGGGFWNEGTLTLRRVAITGNKAGYGGGILNNGTLTVSEALISENAATDKDGGWSFGGGLYVLTGSADLTNVTVSANVAVSPGSGLGAGLMFQEGTTSYVKNCTIVNNIGPEFTSGHGLLGNGSPTIDFLNNLVANNTGENCYQIGTKTGAYNATENPVGYNISSDSSCGFWRTGDRINTDPQVGTLQDNGGPTFTHALLYGSPAIDAGTATNAPAIDQRGVSRPQGSEIDIGAFEYVLGPTIAKEFSPTSISLHGTSTLTFTITNPNSSMAFTGLAFTDTFPAGIQVAASPAVVNTCEGTFTAVAGATSVSLSDGQIAQDGLIFKQDHANNGAVNPCSITVNVTGVTVGTWDNTTGALSTVEGGAGGTSNTATLTVTNLTDLSIVNTVSTLTPQVGSNVVHTVMVTNAGPTTATGVVMTHQFPSSQVILVSYMAPADWTCIVSPAGLVQCSKATAMAVSETATFTVSLNVNCDLADGSTITHTSAVSFPGTDANPANNSSSVTGTASNPTQITPGSHAFKAPGGNGTVWITGVDGCAWTAASNAGFVTVASGASGTGNGAVNFTVAANATNTFRTGTLTIAGFLFEVRQTAIGQEYLTVPGGGSNSDTETNGTGDGTFSGYAKVLPLTSKRERVNTGTGSLFATAVLSLTQNGVVVSEVGEPSQPPTTKARIFVDYRNAVAAKGNGRNAGTINVNTGVAVVNLGDTTGNVTFTLRGPDGTTLATGHGTLAPGSHRAQYIDQLSTLAPDFVLSGDFASVTQFGTLEVASDQPVSVLGLRLVINQRGETLLTTTPAADLKQPLPFGTAIFPQMADGGGYQTTVLLMNPTLATATGTLEFLDNTGAPLTVHPVNGEAATSFRYRIEPNGVYVFETDGTPSSVDVGSAEAIPDVFRPTPVGAGVFSYTPAGVMVTQSGVPAATPTTHARIYVDLAGGHDTGLALTNPSNRPLVITLQAYQSDGVTKVGAAATVDLAANGHTSAFIDQLLTGLPSGFTGVADVSAPTPFAALALRSLVNTRGDFLLTLLPIADFTEPAPTPIVFPQIADGGGYQTQILLVNTQAVDRKVLVSFFDDSGNPLNVIP